MRLAPVALVALASAASLAWSRPATAQVPPAADAHDAYARGTAAFRRSDYATAAREYAAADALAPNPVALQAAIDATVLGDDPVFGTVLLERARGEARTNALLTTMLTAEKKFAHRVGRIRLECPSPPCLAAIDGAAAVTGEPIVVRVGSHSVTLEATTAVVQRTVTVAPDETVVIGAASATPIPTPTPTSTPTPTPTPTSTPIPTSTLTPIPTPTSTSTPTPTPTPTSGLSPLFFEASLAATVVAGAFATGFAIDTASKHSSFAPCLSSSPSPPASCSSLASEGRGAQLRTNVLLGVTGALAGATLVTALLTRWHSASLSVGASRLSFDARF
ncbi:MAG: hypothetical protein ABSE49_14505 [Polyangiaceae bacterium]